MKSTPVWRVLLAAALTLTVSTEIALAQAKKPNILVIWGDDIGIANISAYSDGLMGYTTPNIDRIAKEGFASSTTTASKAARAAARHSSPGSTASAPG
jgi:arylsulfatase